MSDNVYIGRRCASVSKPPALKPISKVILWIDNERFYEAGDDTGREHEITCPYGTQEMADNLLRKLSGYKYQPVTVSDALLDPAAELGDPVTVDDCYTVMASLDLSFDGLLAGDISAPGAAELAPEYTLSSAEKILSRKIARANSRITKTAEEIRLEVQGVEENLSYLEVDLDAITGKVKNIEGDIGTLELTAESLTGRIEDAEDNIGSLELTANSLTGRIKDAEGNIGTLELTAKSLKSEISGKIGESSAKTLIDQSLGSIRLSASSSSGSTTFELTAGGAKLNTETLDISVKATKISGKITADKLNITGAITFDDLEEWTQSVIADAWNTANDAYELADSVQLPSYLETTYIGKTEIRSPTIVGGEFYGNEFNVISESGNGSFNLHGTVNGSDIHALSISYYGYSDPYVVFSSPDAASATWGFDTTYVQGTLSLGKNDINFYVNGKIVTLRDLEARISALEA